MGLGMEDQQTDQTGQTKTTNPGSSVRRKTSLRPTETTNPADARPPAAPTPELGPQRARPRPSLPRRTTALRSEKELLNRPQVEQLESRIRHRENITLARRSRRSKRREKTMFHPVAGAKTPVILEISTVQQLHRYGPQMGTKQLAWRNPVAFSNYYPTIVHESAKKREKEKWTPFAVECSIKVPVGSVISFVADGKFERW